MDYSSQLYTDKRYSPGSFCCIFSCICSYVLVKSKIDIKTFPLLPKHIKSLTMGHLKKKADVFNAGHMKKVLTEMYDDNNPKESADKIAASLLYYGLLRRVEALQINQKYISLDSTEVIEV